MTTDHILSTKLMVPAGPPQFVERPRLELPEQAPRIVLVSAPAGYGKTTLVASWTSAMRGPVAWLSLDDADNDPTRFLMHFVSAIQTHEPDFGKVVMDMLACVPPPPVPGLMRSLVNQFCAFTERLCLVFDDLHLVTDGAVHEALAFLVDHQPPQLQLIFASRSDPPFSIARLRGQRQLLEYRAADLRFTAEEAAKFCKDTMHVDLSEEQIATLTARTEGWAVGLQFAALSLCGVQDRSGFISSFAGDNRHITDFLLDEVLRTRSEDMQNFLLHTSILERFNASLCDAITGRDDSRAMIDEMERTNMFLVGLDHQRNWYRYHHLFSSLLHTRLQQLMPDMASVLYRRASRWFSEKNLVAEAIGYAIKGDDHEYAADLLEKHGTALFSHGRVATVLIWSERLPQELLARRPALSMLCAWGAFYMDSLNALDRHIRAAAACLPHAAQAPFGSKERAMYGQLAVMRGCHLGYNGQLESAIAQFKEALSCFSPERTMYHGAAVCLGVCYFAEGRFDESLQLLQEHANLTEIRYNLLVPITATLGLGRLHLLRGDLLTAKEIYARALRECEKAGWQDFPACGMLHIGLGELAYEMNDLAMADRHLRRGIQMTAVGMWCFNAWGRILHAQTKLAQGAVEDLPVPENDYTLMKYAGRFVVDIAPVSAVLGKLWLRQGRMDAMALWAGRAGLPTSGSLMRGREAEYVVLARHMIAAGDIAPAIRLLDDLWPAAEQARRRTVLVEIMILKAIALQAKGDMDAACAALRQAVDLAENTGLIRLFLDEDIALAGLIKKLARSGECSSYARYLFSQFTHGHGASEQEEALPLLFSKKEKEVVNYIVNGSSNQEIARELAISSNTVNSHMKNIYSKLGVNSRLQAIRRLRELGVGC
jgi:LuxR family maltose regulon positive regulatory protein